MKNPQALLVRTTAMILVIAAASGQANEIPGEFLGRVIATLPVDHRSCAAGTSEHCLAGRTDEGMAVLHTVYQEAAKEIHELRLIALAQKRNELNREPPHLLMTFDHQDYLVQSFAPIPVDRSSSVVVLVTGNRIDVTIAAQ